MKKINIFPVLFLILITGMILVSGCKKKEETPVTPVFTVSAATVQLQSGGEGLQFTAKCTNNEVRMTNALITAPVSGMHYQKDLTDLVFGKNAAILLQTVDEAYPKEPGTWQFTFTGTRTSDNQGFSVNTTLAVTTK